MCLNYQCIHTFISVQDLLFYLQNVHCVKQITNTNSIRQTAEAQSNIKQARKLNQSDCCDQNMKSEFLLTTQFNRKAVKFKFVNMTVKTFKHYSEQSISDILLFVHQIENNSSISFICSDDLSLIQLTMNTTNSDTVMLILSLCSEFFQNIDSQLLEQNELAQHKAY